MLILLTLLALSEGRSFYIDAVAGTTYVGGNNQGSISSPWLSFEDAVNAKNMANLIVPGDSILFNSANTHQLTYWQVPTGNATHGLTVDSYGGAGGRALLVCVNYTGNTCIDLPDANNVTIANIKLAGSFIPGLGLPAGSSQTHR